MVAQDDVQQLATQCREVEKLLELPVGVVHALLSGDEQSADLDTLMEWLVRAKELSSRNVQLADSLLGAGQQLNHDAKGESSPEDADQAASSQPLCLGIFTLRGSCSWGEYLTTSGGFCGELGTAKGVWGDDCRWELYKLPGRLVALRNAATGCWITAERDGRAVCDRTGLKEWETWRMYVRQPWGEGQLNIALRSYHNLFLCQEVPGHPGTGWWPPQRIPATIHRTQHNTLHVLADRVNIQEWETFTLADESGQPLPAWLLKLMQSVALPEGS